MTEKKTNFTPGPWKVMNGNGIMGGVNIYDKKWKAVAYTAGCKEEWYNAIIMAAAPEMNELLEYWLEEANRGMKAQFHRWINAGLKREDLLRDEVTQKYIEKIRQTKRLLKQIKEGNYGCVE